MTPIPRITYEVLCRVYGEPLARLFWHPAPPGLW